MASSYPEGSRKMLNSQQLPPSPNPQPLWTILLSLGWKGEPGSSAQETGLKSAGTWMRMREKLLPGAVRR